MTFRIRTKRPNTENHRADGIDARHHPMRELNGHWCCHMLRNHLARAEGPMRAAAITGKRDPHVSAPEDDGNVKGQQCPCESRKPFPPACRRHFSLVRKHATCRMAAALQTSVIRLS